jgi:hypothetical protein
MSNNPAVTKNEATLSGTGFGANLRKFGATLGLAGAMISALPKEADGAVMLASGTTLPGEYYKNYGAQFADSAVAIKTVSPTSGTVRYASGVQLDEYTIITAAHVLDTAVGFRPFANVFVVGGVNFKTPDFVSSIASYVVHPTYVQGSGLGTGSQVDLAVITLSNPIYGRGVDIGLGAPTGSVLAMAGYGQHGLSSSALQPQDGYIRAFESQVVDSSSVLDNNVYGTGIGFSVLNLEGQGAPYYSGGGVFYDGKLIGLIHSGAGSASTNFLKLTPDVRDFIGLAVPEPTKVGLIAAGLLSVAFKRRRRISLGGGR